MTFDYIDTLLFNNLVILYMRKICVLTLTRCHFHSLHTRFLAKSSALVLSIGPLTTTLQLQAHQAQMTLSYVFYCLLLSLILTAPLDCLRYFFILLSTAQRTPFVLNVCLRTVQSPDFLSLSSRSSFPLCGRVKRVVGIDAGMIVMTALPTSSVYMPFRAL